ncbi:MAG: hypothetical protein KAY24_01640, partial [Candidatus Eisenbacteria sp.]|nr:hypothetical protein [Candidatus Eisenbacteria bacterium]
MVGHAAREDPSAFGDEFKCHILLLRGDNCAIEARQNLLNHALERSGPHSLDSLAAWHNHAVARYYRSLDAYDPEGIFIADGTYLFVPDNPRYEDSDVLTFDKHNHPVSKKEIAQLPEHKKRQLHTERCYRKVDLLHTTRDKD